MKPKSKKATVEEMMNELLRLVGSPKDPFVMGLANSIITEYDRVMNIVRQPEKEEEPE